MLRTYGELLRDEGAGQCPNMIPTMVHSSTD